MIVVTGAAGFIGSCLVSELNKRGYENIVVVDEFMDPEKDKNLEGKTIKQFVERDGFHRWLDENHSSVDFIFHIGARTDTAEFNFDLLNRLNLAYTQELWDQCTHFDIPLLYASSAATYGLGEKGFVDSHTIIGELEPLNPYGKSKNEFDRWAIHRPEQPPFWVGLKFFNVFGPNEYHKGRMGSVVMHAYNQIKKTGQMKLFRSHHPDYKDGEQRRDFIYIKDILDILFFFFNQKGNQEKSGIYNAGTGHAHTFLDLTEGVFEALEMEPTINFIDTPEDIRDKYQYFTEADTTKLRQAGFDQAFRPFKASIHDYVSNYLEKGIYY